MFAGFRPHLPDAFRSAEWVFLANIDPELQYEVLEQVNSPRLVACDTMNFWIEGKRDALLRLLGRVDVLLINDAEIRALSGEHNLVAAAKWVQARGPEIVVIKKGEHGAMLFTPEMVFFVPGFPLEELYDPTGAGDSFAGGFLGYLAQSARARRMISGGRWCTVPRWLVSSSDSASRLRELDPEVEERVQAFRR